MSEPEYVAARVLACLIVLGRKDKRATCAAAASYLERHGAGVPDVPLFREQVRSEALMWAACATQEELEAYIVAAVGELGESPVLVNQIKRLAAMAYHRMGDDDKRAFKAWTDKL